MGKEDRQLELPFTLRSPRKPDIAPVIHVPRIRTKEAIALKRRNASVQVFLGEELPSTGTSGA